MSSLVGRAGIRDVRVKGAIGVVEFDRIGDLDAMKARFVSAGVWVRPFRDIAYLTPALTVTDEELETLIGAMISVASQTIGERDR